MTDPAVARPRYRLLRDVLAREIVEGRWKPGDKIPTEAELQAQNNVAMGTLVRALELLEAEGLIERQQGRGTFVRRPDFRHYTVQSIRCHGSAGDPRTPQARIVERLMVTGPPEITDALHLQAGIDVIRMKRLRSEVGRVVLVETIWLDQERFAPILTIADPSEGLLYPVYEDLCGQVVARIRETLTIDISSALDCETFNLPAVTPMANIQRIGLGYDDRPIELRCTRGPATDLRYTLDIF